MGQVNDCSDAENDAILKVINCSAAAYQGVIPRDCWHEPYMGEAEFLAERDRGVSFAGYKDGGRLVGVMGLEPREDVELVRHAYVLPEYQGRGVGSALLEFITAKRSRQILVGTWQAAAWAIRFYERHGFMLPSEAIQQELLQRYWTISPRMAACSVVLASPPLSESTARP